MSQQIPTTQAATQPHIPDELVLVVRRELLFPDGAWHGVKRVDYAEYEQLIRQNQEFLPRARMETDARYKQIIPYLIFTHNGSYFVMQRLAQATEQRLKNKMSLGIGGHINPEDLAGATLVDWARREFAEEVEFNGSFTVEPLGVLNDDSNDVGRVHIGFVYLLHGSSNEITPKAEFKRGEMLPLEECKTLYPNLESWSQMVMDLLTSSTPAL